MSIKKLVIGLAVVAMAFAVVVPANAATIEELQAMIATLTQQLAALSGGTTTTGTGSAVQFNTNLTIGSTGADVTALQQYLVSKGFLQMPANTAYGYFGSLTQAALARYQASVGITPASGYFGPLTRADVNAKNMMTTGGGTTTGGTTGGGSTGSTVLEGDAGSVDSYTALSAVNAENVGVGEEDVKVLGVEIATDAGSDLDFTSMKVSFVQSTAADSKDLDDYAESVAIWFGSEKVGEADVDDFSESSNVWTKTIQLDDAIIKADDTEKVYVTVTALSAIDSSDSDTDAWTADITNVRFEDATGALISEDPGLTAVAFDFDTFATASGLTLKVNLDNDSPDAQVIDVHSTNDTPGVELMRFNIKADGSAMNLREIPITLTTVGGSQVSSVASTLYLEVDGEEYAETIATTAATTLTVTFDNLDIDVDEDDTMEFVVKADINDIAAGTFDEGDTLSAQLTTTNRDYIVARDGVGKTIATGSKSGTALAEAMAFYDTGIKVTLVSTDREQTSALTTTNTNTGQFQITYKVEAFGGTVYVADQAEVTIDTDAIEETTTDEGLYYLTIGGTATAVGLSDAVTYTTGDGASDSSNGNIELADGESANVTLTVTRTNTAALPGGIMIFKLQGIGWSTTDTAYVDGTESFNVYDFDLDDFKTSPLSVN